MSYPGFLIAAGVFRVEAIWEIEGRCFAWPTCGKGLWAFYPLIQAPRLKWILPTKAQRPDQPL